MTEYVYIYATACIYNVPISTIVLYCDVPRH